MQALRKIFYQIIVENKEHGLGTETVFEFKYIPSLGMMSTEKGEYKASDFKNRQYERRGLRTLVIASAAVGVLSYFSMVTAWGLVEHAKAWWC
jgi:hypothetical protein